MKSCKGIKKNGKRVGKSLVQQKNRNNFPYAVKKSQKYLLAKLYEKL